MRHGRGCVNHVRESEADYMSPVVASIYCSPHRSALQIAPAARLRGFCLYDSAHGEFLHEVFDARNFILDDFAPRHTLKRNGLAMVLLLDKNAD